MWKEDHKNDTLWKTSFFRGQVYLSFERRLLFIRSVCTNHQCSKYLWQIPGNFPTSHHKHIQTRCMIQTRNILPSLSKSTVFLYVAGWQLSTPSAVQQCFAFIWSMILGAWPTSWTWMIMLKEPSSSFLSQAHGALDETWKQFWGLFIVTLVVYVVR